MAGHEAAGHCGLRSERKPRLILIFPLFISGTPHKAPWEGTSLFTIYQRESKLKHTRLYWISLRQGKRSEGEKEWQTLKRENERGGKRRGEDERSLLGKRERGSKRHTGKQWEMDGASAVIGGDGWKGAFWFFYATSPLSSSPLSSLLSVAPLTQTISPYAAAPAQEAAAS